MDAVVRRGASDLNESMLTGESVPVEKKEGEELFAGTVNGRGLLIAEATRPLSESTYARILRRVEEAQTEKAPVQTFMERFAAAYTPAVLCMAVLVAVVPSLLGRGPALDWAYRALVMLVIACPCAIVLAAPVVTLSALTRATREGILVKGGQAPRSAGNDPGGGVRQDRHADAGKAPGDPGAGGGRVGRRRRFSGWRVRSRRARPTPSRRRSGGRRPGGASPRRRGGPSPGRSSPWKGWVSPPRWTGGRSTSETGGCSRRWGLAATRSTGSSKTGEARRASVAIVGMHDTLAGAIEMEDELRPEAEEAIRALAGSRRGAHRPAHGG